MIRLSNLPARTLKVITTLFNGFDGALIVDEKGHIVIITKDYAELCGVDHQEVIGKHVLEYFPKSRMIEVLTTGKPIFAELWEAGNEIVWVSRVPIVSDGRIIGAAAVSVFRYMDEAKRFAKRVKNMDSELEYYKSQVRKLSGARYSFDAIVGTSAALSIAKTNAQRMARNRAPVLIVGETGTGKELFAHAIHQASPRRDRPFIRVNCASIPDNLSESELFGYAEGAFTGARKGGRAGKFELAHGGTIFLDEINELPNNIQAKLLRVLQEGEIDRIGGTDVSLVDVRVISATSAHLNELVEQKLFRQDLFYRINAFILTIPSLRERLEDIPLLCEHFIDNCNYELGTAVAGIDRKVLQAFARYDWPGNVRELRNVIQRACLNAGADMIKTNHLPFESAGRKGMSQQEEGVTLQAHLDGAERDYIVTVLQSVRWNRNRAAEILGIHRTSLYAKMKKYGLLEQ
ncbi:MAG: sigma-54 interaction domain-containing protein [Deltaproteobacteria bacterium]